MARPHQYAVCVKSLGYPAALEVRKLYRVNSDAVADTRGLLRVVDELSKDYLYPAEYFCTLELPQSTIDVLSRI